MDPIELRNSEELDSFLSEFGSRGKVSSRRNSSERKISAARKESTSANAHVPTPNLSEVVSNNNNSWKIPDFRKISSLASIKDVNENDGEDFCKQKLVSDEENQLFLGKLAPIVDVEKEKENGEDDLLSEKIISDGSSSNESDSSIIVKEDPANRHRFTGLGLALLSCVAFSFSSLIAKYFSEYHPLSKAVWRFQGLTVPAIPMMLYQYYVKEDRIFDKVWPVCREGNRSNVVMLVLRSTFGLATILLQFFSLQYISLADQIVLGASQPVFVTIVAFFMLGEKCGVMSFVICAFTLMGVVVVAKPPILTGAEEFDMDVVIGSSLAMGSMMMSVMSIVFMRQLRNVHFTLITFSFGLYCTIVCSIAAVVLGVFQVPVGRDHILLAVVFAALVFVSQTCTTIALKYEQAGPVSITRTSNIIFGFLGQWIFLGVSPDKWSLVGASIIAIGVVLTALRKWIGMLPEDHVNRKRFSCLLK